MHSIKFKRSGHSSLLGGFSPGDIVRGLPEAVARHFVVEADAAEYLEQPASQVPPPAAAEEPSPPAKRGRRAKE